MGKKILITGAGGFIGANLIRSLLAQGNEVHVFHRTGSTSWRLAEIKNKLQFHDVEIDDKKAVLKIIEDIQPEQVFHLAHYGGNPNEIDSSMVRKVIIDGTSVLFDACAKISSVKSIIHSGSSSEYGAKASVMKEDMLLEPNTPYACAKAWATLYGQNLAREKKIPITTLRLFSVFGPWEAETRFIPTTILSCLHGMTVKIFNTKTVRDFIYIDDVVRAFLLVADNPHPGEIINIGSGKEMTLLEAAKIILKSTKAKVSIEVGGVGRSFDKTNIMWQADISKAKSLLGWQPMISQEEGLIKTIKWYRENKNLY